MTFPNILFSPIRWVSLLLFTLIVWTGTVFLVNYAVDPFGDREWIATKQYKPIVHERSEKYNLIFNQNNIKKYDCLILGSSRVMSINPSTNDAIKGCYNFGVHTANNPEKLFILQEWLKRGDLKKVYLGNELHNVHPWMHPLEFKSSRFTSGSEGNYLSFSTFTISLKVLKNRFTHQPQTYFNDTGSIVYSQDERDIHNNHFDHSLNHFRLLSIEAVEGNFVKNPFTYEEKALQPLREIQRLCQQHNIKLYAFIPPTYYEAQLQMQSHPNLAAASNKFQNDLVDIFDRVYNFDVDSKENRNPANFYDAVHYRPNLGHLIVESFENNATYGELLQKNKPINTFIHNIVK